MEAIVTTGPPPPLRLLTLPDGRRLGLRRIRRSKRASGACAAWNAGLAADVRACRRGRSSERHPPDRAGAARLWTVGLSSVREPCAHRRGSERSRRCLWARPLRHHRCLRRRALRRCRRCVDARPHQPARAGLPRRRAGRWQASTVQIPEVPVQASRPQAMGDAPLLPPLAQHGVQIARQRLSLADGPPACARPRAIGAARGEGKPASWP